MKYSEKRRAPRAKHDSVLEIYDADGHLIIGIGRLVNFSNVGICFSSTKVLNKGQKLTARVRLLKEGTIEVTARVVWVEKKSNSFLYGIEFDSIQKNAAIAVIVAGAVMALAWGWIFNDSFGVLNDLLARAGLVHGPVAWLGQPGTAMAAMVVADVWKTTPFVALVVLAGLQGIPRSTLDAARVDGASPAQILWRIVLPLIRPAALVALAFRAAQGFGAFDLPYVMTGGGPGGSTETVSLYAYRSFYRYLDFGYGAAIAVEGAGMALLLFAAILWLSNRAREVA